MGYHETLRPEEMDQLVGRLFACSAPNYTADGRKVLSIIPLEEVEKRFGR